MRQEFQSAEDLMAHYDRVSARLRRPASSVPDTPIDLRRKKGGVIELRILSDQEREQVRVRRWVEQCHALAERHRRRAEALREAQRWAPKEVAPCFTISAIKQAVCEYFNLSEADLLSKRRLANLSHARQITYYLARTMANASYPQIAQQFDGRDHTTILYGARVIADRIQKDADLAGVVETIKTSLEQRLAPRAA